MAVTHPLQRRSAVAALLLLMGSLGVSALGACSTPTQADLSGTVPSAALSSVGTTSCTSNYHAGSDSLDIIMQNNTGQTLTLASDWTTIAKPGHWAQQAPSSIPPGGCAVVNGYTDDPLGDFWLTATYQLPDGTYFPFSCAQQTSNNDTSFCIPDVYTVMTTDSPNYMPTNNTQSYSWLIFQSASSGDEHQHFTLVAEPWSQH